MGAWGYGLFQSDYDLDEAAKLSDEIGLYKLGDIDPVEHDIIQTLVHMIGKNNEKSYVGMRMNMSYSEGIYCLYRQRCGSREDADVVREYLDSSDALNKLIERWMPKAHSTTEQGETTPPGYTLVILGACAMTHGCKLSKSFLDKLREVFLGVGLMRDALMQVHVALNEPHGYKNDGTPYDFGSKGLYETADSMPPGPGPVNVPGHAGFPMGHNTNAVEKRIRARLQEIHEVKTTAVCGGCASAQSKDGYFQTCAKCKKRKYCSKKCQKQEWDMHKQICGKEGNAAVGYA